MSVRNFSSNHYLSLAKNFADYLRNAILEGEFAPGQRLVESDLQKKNGISRAPIREAFRLLEKERLVINIPRKGTFVRRITRKDMDENFPLRVILEGLAARMAVPNLNEKDLKKMQLLLDKMIKAVKKKEYKSYHKYHSEFHGVFINRCQNEALIRILEDLRREAIWFRFCYLKILRNQRYIISVHKKIIELLAKKDAEAVEKLVSDHIKKAYKIFQKELSGQDNIF